MLGRQRAWIAWLVGTSAAASAALLVVGIALAQVSASSSSHGGNASGALEGPERIRVLTTFTIIADMTRVIGGDTIDVISLTRPGVEIHGYDPSPQDLAAAQHAQLILENGLGLEAWAARFYESVPSLPHATLTDSIAPVPIADDHGSERPNPHAWMSPGNALSYVDAITAALIDLAPEHARTYRHHAAAYIRQIRAMDDQLRAEVARIPDQHRVLVSCEGAFGYLTRDYGLDEAYLWPINASQQGTPQQIAHVIEVVRDRQIPAVFCESTVSDSAQRQVARETGASFGGVFYVDSLSPDDGPAATYLELLQHNVTTLVDGLSGAGRSGATSDCSTVRIILRVLLV